MGLDNCRQIAVIFRMLCNQLKTTFRKLAFIFIEITYTMKLTQNVRGLGRNEIEDDTGKIFCTHCHPIPTILFPSTPRPHHHRPIPTPSPIYCPYHHPHPNILSPSQSASPPVCLCYVIIFCPPLHPHSLLVVLHIIFLHSVADHVLREPWGQFVLRAPKIKQNV